MADESNSLRVRVVTPERVLFEQTADAVELPAKNGYMEVLYGHAPLLAELGAGDVRIHGAGAAGEQIYNVNWGFVEVLPDRVTILASDALKPEEIDVNRAQQQLDRGGVSKRELARHRFRAARISGAEFPRRLRDRRDVGEPPLLLLCRRKSRLLKGGVSMLAF